MSFLLMPDPSTARRLFLGRSSRMLLSATAVALLAGRPALAARAGEAGEGDAKILNTALAAELEAIAAYQLGADSELLQKPALELARTFQGHHRQHVGLRLQSVGRESVARLRLHRRAAEPLDRPREQGGVLPVKAKPSYTIPTDRLKSQADVLRFAAGLEQGAVSAYLGALPLFGDRELAKAAGSILGDEAMHWAVLRQALGEAPVPAAFVS